MKPLRNQAQLSIAGEGTISSNVAYGAIREVLSVYKKATPEVYAIGRPVTYVITIVNSSSTDFNNISLTDDLGKYIFDSDTGNTAVPLTYVDSSLLYYVNNVLQIATPDPSESVAALTIPGIRVPAGGTATLIYEAVPNEYAQRDQNATIKNTVTITNMNALTATDDETITAEYKPQIDMTKSINPIPVTENERVTYSFLFENSGAAPLEADADATFSDTFNPPIQNVVAYFNGRQLVEDIDYSYDTETGLFLTINNMIEVGKATYSQDPDSGAVSVTPGTSVLIISGVIPGSTT